MADKWPTRPLGELFEFGSGLSKPRSEFGFGYGFLSFKDVFNNFFVPEELSELVNSTEHERNTRSVKRGDVFLTRTSETQEELGMSCVALKDYEEATFNGFTKRLRPKIGVVIEPEYSGYFFRSRMFRNEISTYSSLSTRASLNNEMLGRLTMLLPPLPIQKSIGSTLKKLDDKIELNRRMNRTLEAMAQAIFKSWFVHFEPVRAKAAAKTVGATPAAIERAAMAAIAGRSIEDAIAQKAYFDDLTPLNRASLAQTAALFPDTFQNSELGEIPDGWKVESAEAIVTRLKAGKKFTKKNVLSEGRVPVFDQGGGLLLGFHDGEADVDASPECPRFIFGDHTCITHISLTPFSVGPNVIPLKANARDPYWTFFAIKDLQKFQEYRRHWMEFKIKDVFVPESPIAIRFGDLLKGFYCQIESNTQQSSTLAKLRDTLLPKLLSGELIVPEAGSLTEEVNV